MCGEQEKNKKLVWFFVQISVFRSLHVCIDKLPSLWALAGRVKGIGNQ